MPGNQTKEADKKESPPEKGSAQAPAIQLPKGGGAIRGIGEKFAANPVTGTGSMTVPIATSPGRSGFGPQLSLSYDSGAGNGPFGFGWNLSLPSITRKTDKGLPKYQDAEESDVFILSGAEDLVPVLKEVNGKWEREKLPPRTVDGKTFNIQRYRPRIEGLFARIERWTNQLDPTDTFWRSISKDNITTWYGKDNNSRIFDPAAPSPVNPTRIFSWLICESYDDKGNAIIYEYVPEDSARIDISQAHERNRTDQSRSANRYLKGIKYGNKTSRLIQPDLSTMDWLFEVVFDYDEGRYEELPRNPNEHQFVTARMQPTQPWPVRQDPFSSYRSGFEVRTYRLCHRVLMFHHFKDELGIDDYLVRSTEFTYSESPIASFITSVTQSGYKHQHDETYLKKSLPPLEFEYSKADIQQDVREIDPESLENLPYGLDGTQYQWVDLDGEGISGMLTEQAGGWFYKRNLSPISVKKENGKETPVARFAPLESVANKPSLARVVTGQQQFLDLAGDGNLDLVQLERPLSGFYERTDDADWEQFRPFISAPNIDWGDPNLKFVDLTGDGHADILITEDEAFTWYRSLAEDGFDSAQKVQQVMNEEEGPRLVFADGTQSIYLADISGDGLSDLVRIRNGEVCYWPNLGYGRFGKKVTMDNAPYFDHPELFDQRRIRLADIDGSGTTDIIYLARDGVNIYRNQTGNSWASPEPLMSFPHVDNLASVMATDLLGNGTACLVWSSPLPGDARRHMRYIDLMGGQKPHLMLKTKNNLGAETHMHYAPSTRFYLEDKMAGKPWITNIPFPVHVVEKVTITDKWRQTSFSSTYSYHHGYFDGIEREFRGFGRVEQVDVETFGEFAAANAASPYITNDKTLYQPLVKTVTWYHTGAFLDRERIIGHFQQEYFPNWFEDMKPGQQVLGTFQENALPAPDIDALDLTADEWREALRACKGMMLRQEVYELDVDALADGTHKPVKLFSAACHNCHIHLVQPQAVNRHAVFYVTESEAITYHYELDLRPEELTPDPRIVHTLNLSIDEYGNIQQSVAAVYPRRDIYVDNTLKDGAQNLIQHVQSELHLAYTETRYTNDVPEAGNSDPDNYRLRLPCEVMTYELTGIGPEDAEDIASPDPQDNRYFTLNELRGYKLSDKYQNTRMAVEDIAYHLLPNRTSPQKRIVEHARSLFFKTSLDNPEVLGIINALGLPYESYKLALSDDILSLVFKDKLTPLVNMALADKKTSGYLSDGDLIARFGGAAVSGQYWICAGTAGFVPDAAQHFYLPERYTDPFGNVTTLEYDLRDLFIQSSVDALGNRTEVTDFDYRVLAPCKIKDVNNNLSEVCFDILGMPAAMAVMGKGSEADSLSAFDDTLLNPDLASTQDFFINNDYNVAVTKNLLRGASARHMYYFGEVLENRHTVWGQHPACACGIVREQHAADVQDSPVQCTFEYSDGTGNVLVKKIQAEPETGSTTLRWIASGKIILNNKGKPVKQYEPYFSPPAVGHRFEEPAEIGVTPVIYYDAVGRVIRTESPDGSYSRVEFSSWLVRMFDQNDTVMETNNAWFARKADALATEEEKRAARQVAEHADTPSVTLLDSLGREVIAIAHNRIRPSNTLVDEKYVTFTRLDAEGKPLWIQDQRGNRVMQYIMPPLRDGVYTFDDENNFGPQGFVPCYDIAGNLLFQHSMDAGERWMLNDAAGKPMFAWNSRGYIFSTMYDALHRPVEMSVSRGDGPSPLNNIYEKIVYGENQSLNGRTDTELNLRGKPFLHWDTAGLIQFEEYDFKGNLLKSNRRLVTDYKAVVNWAVITPESLLENETFALETHYDAMNRVTLSKTPDGSITIPIYNEANLLDKVDVTQDGATTHFVTNIDYNAKGQRIKITYGNEITTMYDYDKETFRLLHLQTKKANGKLLQDLYYTYDPVGNITQIEDKAIPTVFFNNFVIEPINKYTYDPIYRLIEAEGREHIGQVNFGIEDNWNDLPFLKQYSPNDPMAWRNYTQQYKYDAVGNIEQMKHIAAGGNWTRDYQYETTNNRLRSTSVGSSITYTYPHHPQHGFITGMPHLQVMKWNFKDELQAVAKQKRTDGGTPETTYYVYDSSGQRVRKITENAAAPGTDPTKKEERIYLGAYEIYREHSGTHNGLERKTFHVMDSLSRQEGGNSQRIAMVETRNDVDDGTPKKLIRYQFTNHLGTASLETDDAARVISFEEYHPYGTTSYQAVDKDIKAVAKRYRYTGKERDEETMLYYHKARYYAPWLGRWTSCDPKQIAEGVNLYAYVKASPTTYTDPSGCGRIPIHFWVTLLVAYAAGLGHESAIRQATGAQLPDILKTMDAIAQFKEAWSHPVSGAAGGKQRTAYNAAHALVEPDYDNAVGYTSREEQQITKNFLMRTPMRSLEFYIGSHRYGDTFYHTYKKLFSNEEVPHNRGILNQGHTPPGPFADDAGRDLGRLLNYASGLYDVFRSKGDVAGESGISKQQLFTILEGFYHDVGSKSDEKQILYLESKILNTFFSMGEDEFNKLSLEEKLSQSNAYDLLVEAANIPTDAITTEDFRKNYPKLYSLVGDSDISDEHVNRALKNVQQDLEIQRRSVRPR